MRLLWIALLTAALSACGLVPIIDEHSPLPAGFPKLKVHEHHVAVERLAEFCQPLQITCSWVAWAAGRCDIYIAPNTPAPLIAHERKHCDGRDHIGESTIRNAFARWYAAQPHP